jgi:hypothetical protein
MCIHCSMSRFVTVLVALAVFGQTASAGSFLGVTTFEYFKDGLQILTGLASILNVTNPQPVTGLGAPVVLIFNETKDEFNVQMSGGTFTGPTSSQAFGFAGQYWRGTISIAEVNTFAPLPTLSSSGSFSHVADPPIQWASNLISDGDLIFRPPHGNGKIIKSDGTEDDYQGGISKTRDLFGHVTTFSFVVSGSHQAPSPEPATITLLAIGIAGMAGYAWRRRKTQQGEIRGRE